MYRITEYDNRGDKTLAHVHRIGSETLEAFECQLSAEDGTCMALENRLFWADAGGGGLANTWWIRGLSADAL